MDRLKREFNVNVSAGAQQVAYRETITKPYELCFTHKKQIGGSGQSANVPMMLEPNPGEGFEFVNDTRGGAVPKEHIPGALKGIEAEMPNGIQAGSPVVDVKAKLVDGAFHPVDSSVMASEIAGRVAFRGGAAQCNPIILEPVMNIEVITPEECMGAVIGDLNPRRGVTQSLDAENQLWVFINCMALKQSGFGSACHIPRASIEEAPEETDIVSSVISEAQAKMTAQTDKNVESGGRGKRILGILQLGDASDAGGGNASQRALNHAMLTGGHRLRATDLHEHRHVVLGLKRGGAYGTPGRLAGVGAGCIGVDMPREDQLTRDLRTDITPGIPDHLLTVNAAPA